MIKLEMRFRSRPPKIDLDWLSRATMQSKYPFPQSYLNYAQQYGYGRALGLLVMYAPDKDHPDSILSQGKKVRNLIRMVIDGGYMEYEPDGSRELAEQLFPFAMSENGEYFGWGLNPGSLRNGERPEYPIYCVGARMASMRHAADDLDGLLRRLTSQDVKSVLGPGYAPLPKTFHSLE